MVRYAVTYSKEKKWNTPKPRRKHNSTHGSVHKYSRLSRLSCLPLVLSFFFVTSQPSKKLCRLKRTKKFSETETTGRDDASFVLLDTQNGNNFANALQSVTLRSS